MLSSTYIFSLFVLGSLPYRTLTCLACYRIVNGCRGIFMARFSPCELSIALPWLLNAHPSFKHQQVLRTVHTCGKVKKKLTFPFPYLNRLVQLTQPDVAS